MFSGYIHKFPLWHIGEEQKIQRKLCASLHFLQRKMNLSQQGACKGDNEEIIYI